MQRAWWNATIKQRWGRRRGRRTGRRFWNSTTSFCFFLLYHGNTRGNTTPLSPGCSLIIPVKKREGAFGKRSPNMLLFFFSFLLVVVVVVSQPACGSATATMEKYYRHRKTDFIFLVFFRLREDSCRNLSAAQTRLANCRHAHPQTRQRSLCCAKRPTEVNLASG